MPALILLNPDHSKLTDKLKQAMIDVAKIIINEKINANLTGIHPIYDTDKMSPSWKMDSLLCAAYFSIFYLNPELELYRPCQNPRCGKYFLVKATSTRVQYCSTACCNRVTQDRYRKKKREKRQIKRILWSKFLPRPEDSYSSSFFTPYGAGSSATIITGGEENSYLTGLYSGNASAPAGINGFPNTVSIHSARATFSFNGFPE